MWHLLSFILLSVLSTLTLAKGPVWQVSNGQHSLYIAGTVHVLSERDYPLPKEFEQAYQQASHIVFETDMQALNSPQGQSQLLHALRYPAWESLAQHLNPATLTKLKNHCEQRGIPLGQIIAFRPGMAVSLLTMMELKHLGLHGTGVDDFYQQKALRQGKSIGQLESPQQQISFIAAMGEGSEDKLMNYTLRDISELKRYFKNMVSAWRKGDMAALNHAAMADELAQQFPNIHRQLLLQRNINWLDQIETMISNPQVEMVLVGAMHLAGKGNVLELLEQRGYRVKQL